MGKATTLTQVLQNAVGASGNGAVMDVSGLNYLSLQVSGTLTTITVNFEGSNDGVNWFAVPFVKSDGTNASSTAAAGMFETYFVGYLLLRARVTWSAGVVTVIAAGYGN